MKGVGILARFLLGCGSMFGDGCSEDDEEKLQVKRVERDDESLQRLQIMFTNRKERSERGRRD